MIVTHSMQQAARVSQKTAFFHLGNLVEYGETGRDLHQPARTRAPKATSPAGSAKEDTCRDQHIASAFDRDLEAIQAHIMKMGGLVEAAILDAP